MKPNLGIRMVCANENVSYFPETIFLVHRFIPSYDDTSSSIDRQKDCTFTFNQSSKLLAYKVKVKHNNEKTALKVRKLCLLNGLYISQIYNL